MQKLSSVTGTNEAVPSVRSNRKTEKTHFDITLLTLKGRRRSSTKEGRIYKAARVRLLVEDPGTDPAALASSSLNTSGQVERFPTKKIVVIS